MILDLLFSLRPTLDLMFFFQLKNYVIFMNDILLQIWKELALGEGRKNDQDSAENWSRKPTASKKKCLVQNPK